jgi:hypothetical protein
VPTFEDVASTTSVSPVQPNTTPAPGQAPAVDDRRERGGDQNEGLERAEITQCPADP